MNSNRYGNLLAMKEHLLEGNSVTRLEAIILFGVSNLPDSISKMRRQGWFIKSRLIPYAAALKRVNKHAVLRIPNNLPVREIKLTEYWLNK